ncbi:unnamed protein product [Trichogramma brassicae]|uniref:Histone H2A n=1 Tax=Trichogramma brassicae TaxID=86971 RepID=A0A6H5J0Y2_9HYME|nr:unnamed protein product [Trichogramma brassicae]
MSASQGKHVSIGKVPKSGKKRSRSTRAGLQFPWAGYIVSCARADTRSESAPELRSTWPPSSSIWPPRSWSCRETRPATTQKSRIIPRHFQLAVRNDDELSKLLAGVTVAQGGAVPFIHSTLLPVSRSAIKKE